MSPTRWLKLASAPTSKCPRPGDIPLRIVTEGAATERRMALTVGIDNRNQRGFFTIATGRKTP